MEMTGQVRERAVKRKSTGLKKPRIVCIMKMGTGQIERMSLIMR